MALDFTKQNLHETGVPLGFPWERKILLTNQTSYLGAWEKVLVVVVGNIQLETFRNMLPSYQWSFAKDKPNKITKQPFIKKTPPEVNL